MFLIIVFAVAVYFLIQFVKWMAIVIRVGNYTKNYPGPKPTFLIGNAKEFGGPDEALDSLCRFLRDHGLTIRMGIGLESNLVTADPKLVEFLLSSNTILGKSAVYDFLQNWIGTGLLTAPAEKWRKHRKILTPTFHFQILEQFVDNFDTNSTILVQKLRKEAEELSTDLVPFITHCTLDIICETAMGTQINAQKDTENEYTKSLREECVIILKRTFIPFLAYDFIYSFTSMCRREKKALSILHGQSNSVIKKKKQKLLEQNKTHSKVEDDVGIKTRKALLDYLLEANIEQSLLTDDEIRQEVDTFMFAGHDTTSSAISFLLYNLSEHPEIQEKVVEELKQIFHDDRDRPLALKDLQEMKYLEMVIKETLRLYPSVPYFARTLKDEAEYEGKILPKELAVIIVPFFMHRNPDYFPDPEKFDPDRWLPENQTERLTYSYIPFSVGPRNCIGQKYAMLEMKSVVSKVLRHFIVESVGHKLQLTSELALKSKNGIKVRLVKRQW